MKEYCFGTLAVGKEYQKLALLLAKDIEIYAPETKLVILTNNPKYFDKQSNVLAYKYQGQSVKIYNDKRLVLEKALSMYNSCVFVDADIRISEKIPEDIEFTPGILAFSSCSLMKFMTRKNDKPNIKNKKIWLNQEIINKVANYWQINLEKAKFIHEYFFIVTKNEKFDDFIEKWEILAGYFELKGRYAGEGYIIGLAAAKTGFPINYDYEKKIKFFKDRLILGKVRKKEEVNEQELQFLEQRKSLNYSSNIFVKINKRLKKKLVFWIRLLNLKFTNSGYQEIYQCFDSKG